MKDFNNSDLELLVRRGEKKGEKLFRMLRLLKEKRGKEERAEKRGGLGNGETAEGEKKKRENKRCHAVSPHDRIWSTRRKEKKKKTQGEKKEKGSV